MNTPIWWHYFIWILAAGGVGFAVALLFADRLQLPRRVFLIPYVGLAGGFVVAYLAWSDAAITALLADNWVWGVVAGIAVGAITIANVRSQPATRESTGPALVLDVLWLGLAYGLVDGLFLNVMPVLAAQQGLASFEWATGWPGVLLVGAIALAASLLVALAYHVGYAEFRNRSVALVLVGNGLITLAFLLSGNPLGAIIGHIVMHLAAVLRGPDTTLQLPPHQTALQ